MALSVKNMLGGGKIKIDNAIEFEGFADSGELMPTRFVEIAQKFDRTHFANAYGYSWDCVELSNGDIFAVFFSDSYNRARVYRKVDGEWTIYADKNYVLGTPQSCRNSVRLVKISDTKILAVFDYSSNINLYMAMLTIDGTTISASTRVAINSASYSAMARYFDAFAIDSTTVGITSTNAGKIYTVDVSGDTPTITHTISTGFTMDYHKVMPIGDNDYLFVGCRNYYFEITRFSIYSDGTYSIKFANKTISTIKVSGSNYPFGLGKLGDKYVIFSKSYTDYGCAVTFEVSETDVENCNASTFVFKCGYGGDIVIFEDINTIVYIYTGSSSETYIYKSASFNITSGIVTLSRDFGAFDETHSGTTIQVWCGKSAKVSKGYGFYYTSTKGQAFFLELSFGTLLDATTRVDGVLVTKATTTEKGKVYALA